MVRMKNKIVCFFGILFIILCMPFHIYAEAGTVPDTLEEETGRESIVTCKVKSFYSDDVKKLKIRTKKSGKTFRRMNNAKK